MSADRLDRWLAAALDRVLLDVTEAGQGERNVVLSAKAYRLGRLIPHGLEPARAEERLLAAAHDVGLSSAEARSSIRNGLRQGERHPAKLPADLESRSAPRRAPPLPDKTPPPDGQVADLWGRSGNVYDDPPVSIELRERGFDPAAIADEDLARVVPVGPLPRWAGSGVGSWAVTGHRLLLPMYDAAGALRSIHARTLRRELPPGTKKGLSPMFHSIGGLAFADAAAQALLRGERPAWWDGTVLFTEGVPGWLALALLTGDAAERRLAAFGYITGSWKATLAARVPAGADVVLWAHADKTGADLAQGIVETLSHCRVRRVAAQEVQ